MKILHVISSVNPAGGGPVEGVKQLGTILRSEGHQRRNRVARSSLRALCEELSHFPYIRSVRQRPTIVSVPGLFLGCAPIGIDTMRLS